MKRLMTWALTLCLLAGCLPVYAGEETAIVSYQYGDSGEDVLALQTRLKELLYYTGPLSGNYMEQTREAVKAVQTAYGMNATGVADTVALTIIFGECYRPLQYGSSGADVERLQQRLIDLGYYTGRVSGNYLDGSQAGIEKFQSEHGLEATGKADVRTLEMLYDPAMPTAVPSPTPSPSPTPAPTKEPDVSYQGKLQYGSEASRVKVMQQRLLELGYFEGKTTTGFYKKTQAAVKAFQLQNGLTDDGVVGEETWNAIFAVNAVDAASTPKPTPVPTPVPYFIEVDVVNQVTKVFGLDENGEYTVPVRNMICSTGTRSDPSDVGYWTLNGYHVPWAFFSKWGSYAQYWTRINSSIAFHSVIYNTVDTMDLSVSSYKKLGQRASHGCIRLTVADAKWMYENIGKGVTVWIHETGKSDPELTASLKPAALNYNNMLPYVTPTPSPSPVYVSDGMPPQPFRQLKSGSSGEDVYWLQMKLKEMGYYAGTVTGTYLGGTVSAVKSYQKAAGLSVDGVAGTRTLKAIYAEVLATPAPTESPAPEVTPAPDADTTATPDPLTLPLG